MGYSTDFTGRFAVTPPLKPHHAAYLKAFSETRRMVRDATYIKDAIRAGSMKDPLREAVLLPIGKQGRYFVGGGGFHGQDHDGSVIDHNLEPKGQPSLWCRWVPSEDGSGIEWDGGEKFYYYADWIEYLIEHFLKPWGYVLNGSVKWQGEVPADRGVMRMKDNVLVKTSKTESSRARRTWGDWR